ncbi:hypothetical protein A3K63_05650 [Candidatus Micrarchaeota archaeon RBG_16_49_10]|nr:MAG: hypothetical protein A3K63_05650 [Candidatus Micrarchaeota archaeon RBG_16_49_10]
MVSPKDLVRHELMDLDVEVVKSSNRDQVGLKGKVVDETYSMLIIRTADGREKAVAKKDAVFVFTIPNGTRVEVDGKVIVSRPEDRVKKKLKTW